jgi:hypothetical protein
VLSNVAKVTTEKREDESPPVQSQETEKSENSMPIRENESKSPQAMAVARSNQNRSPVALRNKDSTIRKEASKNTIAMPFVKTFLKRFFKVPNLGSITISRHLDIGGATFTLAFAIKSWRFLPL